MRITRVWCVSLLAASATCAPFEAQGKQGEQEKAAAPTHDMEHMHHGGFMQRGMHHAGAKGVKLDAQVDAAAHTVTLPVGPVNLPAPNSHMKMPQPPARVWDGPAH